MAISLDQLQATIEQFPQGKLYFQTPVQIKPTPHFLACTVWGVWAHGVNGVWLLDGEGVWHPLKEDDRNADLVIASVTQRLRLHLYGQKDGVRADM